MEIFNANVYSLSNLVFVIVRSNICRFTEVYGVKSSPQEQDLEVIACYINCVWNYCLTIDKSS